MFLGMFQKVKSLWSSKDQVPAMEATVPETVTKTPGPDDRYYEDRKRHQERLWEAYKATKIDSGSSSSGGDF